MKHKKMIGRVLLTIGGGGIGYVCAKSIVLVAVIVALSGLSILIGWVFFTLALIEEQV